MYFGMPDYNGKTTCMSLGINFEKRTFGTSDWNDVIESYWERYKNTIFRNCRILYDRYDVCYIFGYYAIYV